MAAHMELRCEPTVVAQLLVARPSSARTPRGRKPRTLARAAALGPAAKHARGVEKTELVLGVRALRPALQAVQELGPGERVRWQRPGRRWPAVDGRAHYACRQVGSTSAGTGHAELSSVSLGGCSRQPPPILSAACWACIWRAPASTSPARAPGRRAHSRNAGRRRARALRR